MSDETRVGQLATPESFIGKHLYWVFYSHVEDRFFFSQAKGAKSIRDYVTPLKHAEKLPDCSYITTFSVDDHGEAQASFDNIVAWHRDVMSRTREKG